VRHVHFIIPLSVPPRCLTRLAAFVILKRQTGRGPLSGPRRGADGLPPTAEHANRLQGHQSRADQLIQSRQECVNPLFGIDNLHDYREISWRLDTEFAIDPAIGAETQRAVKDRGAVQTCGPSRLDDGAIKGMPLCAISLADERAKEDGISRRLHGRLLSLSKTRATHHHSTIFAESD
jgi:hypothetical protein